MERRVNNDNMLAGILESQKEGRYARKLKRCCSLSTSHCVNNVEKALASSTRHCEEPYNVPRRKPEDLAVDESWNKEE
jgi:hypothetical protein